MPCAQTTLTWTHHYEQQQEGFITCCVCVCVCMCVCVRVHLQSVNSNPRVVRHILQDWDKELDAAVPVGQQEHEDNQLPNAEDATSNVEEACQ